MEDKIDDMIIVSSNYVPGYKARENLGFVYGLTVRSRGVGGQIGAGIRSVFGGEIKEYVQMMTQSRDQALVKIGGTCQRNVCKRHNQRAF